MISYPTPQASATARALKEGTGDRLSDQIRAVAEAESIPLAFRKTWSERLSRSRRQSDLKKADRDAILSGSLLSRLMARTHAILMMPSTSNGQAQGLICWSRLLMLRTMWRLAR